MAATLPQVDNVLVQFCLCLLVFSHRHMWRRQRKRQHTPAHSVNHAMLAQMDNMRMNPPPANINQSYRNEVQRADREQRQEAYGNPEQELPKSKDEQSGEERHRNHA